jgi:hypothetical protein
VERKAPFTDPLTEVLSAWGEWTEPSQNEVARKYDVVLDKGTLDAILP